VDGGWTQWSLWDHAAPLVGLESKFGIVAAPILPLVTMATTAWDYGPKYRDAT